MTMRFLLQFIFILLTMGFAAPSLAQSDPKPLLDALEQSISSAQSETVMNLKANIAVYECERGQRALVCTIPFEELLENIGLLDDDPELQELKTSLFETGKGRATGCVGTWFEYEVVQ